MKPFKVEAWRSNGGARSVATRLDRVLAVRTHGLVRIVLAITEPPIPGKRIPANELVELTCDAADTLADELRDTAKLLREAQQREAARR